MKLFIALNQMKPELFKLLNMTRKYLNKTNKLAGFNFYQILFFKYHRFTTRNWIL